jgi:hypothetical protein
MRVFIAQLCTICVFILHLVRCYRLLPPKFWSEKAGFLDVLLEHPVGIEKRTIESYAVAHNLRELVAGSGK